MKINCYILNLVGLAALTTAFKISLKTYKYSNFRVLCDKTDTTTHAVDDITSPEIDKLNKKIENLFASLKSIQDEKLAAEQELAKLEEEYGSEISRIKKEFSRMKERSYEEAREVSNKAKIDALKEVLPITARQVFQPTQTVNEGKIVEIYDNIFNEFSKVIEDFGVVRVQSVGQPFDFNFMEAIMTAPSMEYSADKVCIEYQVGYRMGDKCIRPAMVVVSTGPGPAP